MDQPKPRGKRITPVIADARMQLIRELKLRRGRLNIPAKVIMRHMNASAHTVRHLEFNGGHHFSEVLISRYEAAIKAHCKELRALMDLWGY